MIKRQVLFFFWKKNKSNFVTSPLTELSKIVIIPHKSMRFKNTVLSQTRKESPLMIPNDYFTNFTKTDVKVVTFVVYNPRKYPNATTIKRYYTREKGIQQVLALQHITK